MEPPPENPTEHDVRRLCEAGDFDSAVAAALRGYGREILEFLIAFHRSEADASEVFSVFAEGLWKGTPGFAWRSSFRTWAYVIARRASLHHLRKARRRAAQIAPFPEESNISVLAQKVRTETLSFLRTQRRSRLLLLRDSLPPEDRALLMLRVDRQLPWNDLARVLHEGEAELDDAALKREAARLRKRYQLVKDKIYEMARREGLVGGEGDGGGEPDS